ncbi:hypothetical protein [Sciscionella marina]|uniref:hypothetical protein n=1 Tax=Sciscionella marina TaxID=508770 RepID=UPI000370DC9B|nr:hypothetical protein [Sciscionella marina]
MKDRETVSGILTTETTMTTDAGISATVPVRTVAAGSLVTVELPDICTGELLVRLPGTRFAAFVPWHDVDPDA